eukprot:CAMPEP_0119479570 /NCGR_PEP_ID=MMETSP1344-20130328/8773_1 /TAXON_ID=236787 /ORGANISM="Florenciella parvula, Strain CCMP2471" /LENGTH=80 /DNA_ID=CAMNT_0007513811 /DNA_START=510 /DNA_END=753 /DNA_ORIENTATION=+
MAIMCWVMVPLRGVGAVTTLVRIRVITGDTKPSAAEMLCLCGGARASAAAPPHRAASRCLFAAVPIFMFTMVTHEDRSAS